MNNLLCDKTVPNFWNQFRNNVPRWPHRKIKSINKMIQVLEASLGKNETDDTRIKEEIKILMQHREFVMKNPDTLGTHSLSEKGFFSCRFEGFSRLVFLWLGKPRLAGFPRWILTWPVSPFLVQ
jgi:hypothetical protein